MPAMSAVLAVLEKSGNEAIRSMGATDIQLSFALVRLDC
jgi:hypothetical protein